MCYKWLRDLLFLLDPEQAHHFTLRMLNGAAQFHIPQYFIPAIQKPVAVMGLTFPNPVGLAAGLDKNGDYINGLGNLGFGFLEIGSVTPLPQEGNPRPRLFRLPTQEALINRMGLNSKGLAYVQNRLQHTNYKGILGVSITANTKTPLAQTIDDYLQCFRGVYPYASYISIDLSCPNVTGKEGLQSGTLFASLLDALQTEAIKLSAQREKKIPIVIKISPDLSAQELEDIGRTAQKYAVDGFIATNTTRKRYGLEGVPLATEIGGLSGAPLFPLALNTIEKLKPYAGSIPIIGCGGIRSVEDAQKMIDAGASLIQIYTGLIYQGPGLIGKIAQHLAIH